jgi:outer membrane biosynthesis protein TonB
MRNRIALILGIFVCLGLNSLQAQSAGDFFNRAARSYVKTDKDQALQSVNEGLGKFPGDAKLQALKEKLEKEKEEEEEQENKEQQDKQNQEQQDQKQDQKSQGEEGEQDEKQKDGEKTEEDKAKDSESGNPTEKSEEPAEEGANDQMDADLADKQKAMEAFKEKLKAMNLTPEQASQILESMNAAELRYIQQNKKKPTEKPKRGLPDW